MPDDTTQMTVPLPREVAPEGAADAPSERAAVMNRVRRAQGQLGGVLRMMEEGRDLPEVIAQLKAVTRALDKAGFAMLAGELRARAAAGADAGEMAELEKAFLSLS